MFEILDRRTRLTGNQIKILAAAIIGDALEFFDYFLIGFVLAFLIGPWKLTFGQSAMVLMSSGVGAIIGAYVWGWLADRFGRRKVFIGTVLNFSIATGLFLFHAGQWLDLSSLMRFFVGVGVSGSIAWTCRWCRSSCLPPRRLGWRARHLRHPARRRLGATWVPLSVAATGAYCSRLACCRRCRSCWSASGCRNRRAGCAARAAEEARKSLAWALQMGTVGAADADRRRCRPDHQIELVRSLREYPRSLIVPGWQCGADRRLRHHALGASLFVCVPEGPRRRPPR
jgi:putative MFS transporter